MVQSPISKTGGRTDVLTSRRQPHPDLPRARTIRAHRSEHEDPGPDPQVSRADQAQHQRDDAAAGGAPGESRELYEEGERVGESVGGD